MKGFRWWHGAALTCLLSVSALAVALMWIPFPDEKLYPKQAYRFYDRHQTLIAQIISEDGFFRMHVPYEKLSPLFVRALLLHEDQYFHQHPGVNPLAILRAAVQNISHGRIVSGGSTLTMQLARMLDRQPRTMSAKLLETFRAFQLEIRYSKEEILAFYLSMAPYGGNLEGIEAASYAYFNKSSQSLSASESALLIAIPKSPNRFRPDRNPDEARDARDEILKRMFDGGLIDSDQYRRAIIEPVPTYRHPVQNIIPHSAWHYRFKEPGHYEWHTTIDENMQLQSLRMLQQLLMSLKQYNITNGSIVVIDNRTREIRVAVGSSDYGAQESLGANDGCRAPRSPGSTLKPFLYGLAMQEGLVAEKTVLFDIPVNYGGYSPQNYSRDFAGPVTLREALTESLNIPAVTLSKLLGIEKLHKLLLDGGLSTLDQSSHYYGLPLVLGGVEARLIEMVNLYASLANKGVYQPYRMIRDQPEGGDSRHILTPEASWLVTHILTDVNRPDFPTSWQFSKSRPTVAWKTGTSYGHQDAWSIGYTPELTIGVWLGNFDASPSKGLVGSHAAAPLLFDLFQAFQPASATWFAKPEGVTEREVCATCGTIPNRYCRQLVKEYFISNNPGKIQEEICDIPQPILIDSRTGEQASSGTPREFVQEKVFDIWPSEVAAYLLQTGRPVREAPPYKLGNMTGQKYYPPVILSPVRHTEYIQRPDKIDKKHQGIKLEVATTNRIRKVFWFMNDILIGEGDPVYPLYVQPDPGLYQLRVMDDVGGTDEVTLVVKAYQESGNVTP